jgi:hypothetical protein
MPGKKDRTVIKDEMGEKVLKSKRLILGNLKEIYSSFRSKHPELKIGISKFVKLHPKNCTVFL